MLTARSAAAAGDVEGVAVVAAALAEVVPRSAEVAELRVAGPEALADWVAAAQRAAGDLAAAYRLAEGVAALGAVAGSAAAVDRADWAAGRQVRAASRTHLLLEVRLPAAETAARLVAQPGCAEGRLEQAGQAQRGQPARSAEVLVRPALRAALAEEAPRPRRAWIRFWECPPTGACTRWPAIRRNLPQPLEAALPADGLAAVAARAITSQSTAAPSKVLEAERRREPP